MREDLIGDNELIGWETIDEPVVKRELYETASWYTNIEVPPGTYPIVMSKDKYWVFIRYEGTVVSSYFVNRIFQYSSAVVDKDVGNVQRYTTQTQLYCIKSKFDDGTYRLVDGYEFRDVKTVELERYNGEAYDYVISELVRPDGTVVKR